MKNNPLVSVVIPAFNEEEDIGNCISSLFNQSYKNMEILIVDDGSTDNTRKIIRSFKKVKLIEGQHKGPGFSRNLGVKQAKGEIIVLVDADMTFDKKYVEKLIQPIIKGETIGTEEQIQYATNMDNVWSKCWGTYAKNNRSNRGHAFRAILKSEFIKMGGFDPKYGYADDLTFYFKYGLRSTLVPGAICYHRNPSTLKEVYKQSKWIGASLGLQYPLLSIPFLSHLIAFILIPLSLLVIPIFAIYKSFSRKQFSYFGYYLVFYTVRYFGSLVGLFRKLFLNINTR